MKESVDCFEAGGHVGALGYTAHAIADQGLGVFELKLVLGGAGQGDIYRYVPRALAGLVNQVELLGVIFDPAALFVLDAYERLKFFWGKARLVDDGTMRIRKDRKSTRLNSSP